MQCDNCKKEQTWLEGVGNEFICHKCIKKHKLMGLILRTHASSFPTIIKKLNIKNYQELMKITRKQIESIVNLKKIGVSVKTTNVVEL